MESNVSAVPAPAAATPAVQTPPAPPSFSAPAPSGGGLGSMGDVSLLQIGIFVLTFVGVWWTVKQARATIENIKKKEKSTEL